MNIMTKKHGKKILKHRKKILSLQTEEAYKIILILFNNNLMKFKQHE